MPSEDTTPLSAVEVDALLPTLEGWTRSEAVLARTFVFPNFPAITAFLTHLVRTMTAHNHHPDFSLNTGLKMVCVALTTHSVQALTRALNTWQQARGA